MDGEAALFLDCDMAILGAPPQQFDIYDRLIAREYAGSVPDTVFRVQRHRFAQALLAQEQIFLSGFFQSRYEAAARANLSRLLALM